MQERNLKEIEVTPSKKHLEEAVGIRKKISIFHEDYCHAGSSYCSKCYEADRLISKALDQVRQDTLDEVEKLWVEGKFNTEELCRLRR